MFVAYNTRTSTSTPYETFGGAVDKVDDENNRSASVGYPSEYEVRIVEGNRTFLIQVNDEL